MRSGLGFFCFFAVPLASASIRKWARQRDERNLRRPVSTEEHHHVLPYWYLAASHAKPKGKILAVHFDSHDDLSLPFAGHFGKSYLDETHWNRYVARNDVFILDSVVRGLVDEVVWFAQTGGGSGSLTVNVTVGKLTPQAGSPKMFTQHDDGESPYCVCWSDVKMLEFWVDVPAYWEVNGRRHGPAETQKLQSGEKVRCFYNERWKIGWKSQVTPIHAGTHASCGALHGEGV
jgi:hypothetical protein